MSITRRQFFRYLAVLGSTMSASHSYSAIPSAMVDADRHMGIIPSSDESVPAIGLGSWLTFAIDLEDEAELSSRIAIVREFLELGGGMLDSSPMYGVAEEVIGIGLNHIDNQKGLFSATKVWTSGNRQGFLQMENSRTLWGLPGFDLIQVHNLVDWKTHLPTLYTMKEAEDIRYVGVTTSHGRRHDQLMHIMRTQSLDFVQFTYNMLDRQAEQYLLPMAKDRGIAVIINRPFRGGGLFDKFERYELPVWSKEIDCDNWAQFFLKFIISHPAVTCAIPATSQLAHLRENMGAGYGRLPDQAMRMKMAQYVKNL